VAEKLPMLKHEGLAKVSGLLTLERIVAIGYGRSTIDIDLQAVQIHGLPYG
jgi:hypothetical protein